MFGRAFVQQSQAVPLTAATRTSRRARTARVFIETLEDRRLLAGDGLKGQYFPNFEFSGAPALNRIDPGVNFNWGIDAPAPNLPADYFAARWTGQVEPQFTETYTFYTNTDDGVRLWVNGQKLVDAWIDQGATEYSGSITLTAGARYDIRLDYYEADGDAVAQLSWSSASQPKEAVPYWRLYSEVVGSVVSFTLYDADIDAPIGPLSNYDTIDLSLLPTKNLNIRAELDGKPVASVQFYTDSKLGRLESGEPFMLAGNLENNIYAWTPKPGNITVSAVPYFGPAGTGPQGKLGFVYFTVVDPETIPIAPNGLQVRVTSSRDITMSWNDISGDPATYHLERSLDGQAWTLAGTTPFGLFTDSSLQPRTRYHYRVRAVNAAGASTYSGVVKVRTDATPVTIPGFPNELTTGPTNRSLLVPVTSFTVTQDGAVIENVYVTGRIDVSANNVTIRNFVVEAGTSVAIRVTAGFVGTVIEDGEIFGPNSTNGVAGSNYIARRLHVHDMGSDAFRVTRNVIIEACYVHDFGIGPESHGDGVQMFPTDGGNITILNNHFDARNANSALFQVNNGWQIGGNYFNGGNYTVQAGGELGTKFVNNTFGRAFKYGPIRIGSGNPDLLIWIANKWADTGLPVEL